MAGAAIEDFHRDVVRAQSTPLESKRTERRVGGLGCIANCFHVATSSKWIERTEETCRSATDQLLQVLRVPGSLHRDLGKGAVNVAEIVGSQLAASRSDI